MELEVWSLKWWPIGGWTWSWCAAGRCRWLFETKDDDRTFSLYGNTLSTLPLSDSVSTLIAVDIRVRALYINQQLRSQNSPPKFPLPFASNAEQYNTSLPPRLYIRSLSLREWRIRFWSWEYPWVSSSYLVSPNSTYNTILQVCVHGGQSIQTWRHRPCSRYFPILLHWTPTVSHRKMH